MQRYIRSNENEFNLYDICSTLSGIVFVGDARTFEFSDIFGSDELDYPPGEIEYNLTKDDVIKLLDDFKSCSTILLAPRRRTLISENLGVGQIEKEDLLNIVKALTVEDFTKCFPNSNTEHKNDKLVEFITKKSFQLLNGNKLEGVKVYIKIDADETTSEILVAVSFHTTTSYGKHLYMEEGDNNEN